MPTQKTQYTFMASANFFAASVLASLIFTGDGWTQNAEPPNTTAQPASAQSPSVVARIKVSFKLDSRMSGATYGGERWLSPPTFTSGVQEGKEATVEVKVQAVDHKKQPVPTNPTWTAADPTMVTVSPVSPGVTDHVQITVKHAGESKLTVIADGVSRELLVKATSVANGRGMQVAISQ